ncbi:hypothetical protein [Niveibacterium sp. SC-1]|uniref:hypothetical protein n=1 Tax=Niveibacterium sp. SC-1 TaxID=3135646 RepID=UPI00311D5D97
MSVLRSLSCVFAFLLAGGNLLHAAEPALTPVQVAYLNAETRKANEQFAARVAQITGTTPAAISKLMPPEGRIADPAVRVISTLEAQRKETLPDEMKAQINAAERDRRAAIASAREAAKNK